MQQLDFMTIDEYSKTVLDSLDFTKRSEDVFYDTVDLPEFQDKDAETIFRCLKSEIRLIPFCDYLKRYIYLKAGMAGNYRAVDVREYQHIIIDSFAENHTPKSFTETSTKMSALARNWLTQAAVNRTVVFLLGFGLNMCVEDVTGFLTKALRERDFNFKDPLEIIYWYCFKKGYKIPKMLLLIQKYEGLEATPGYVVYGDRTIGLRDTVKGIEDDEALLLYLSRLKNDNRTCFFSMTVAQWFSVLYLQCKKLIAEYYNADEIEPLERQIERYMSDTKTMRLSDAEKKAHIQKMRDSMKVWTYEDITEGDVEKILCCGTPVTSSGNLEKLSASRLSKYFKNRRISRQHIAEILSKSIAVDRFDLITLNFFLFSQNEKYSMDSKNRYIAFVDSTNEILSECMMGELYVANPYECFLLMCILSDCPLATYADVWEMSFED